MHRHALKTRIHGDYSEDKFPTIKVHTRDLSTFCQFCIALITTMIFCPGREIPLSVPVRKLHAMVPYPATTLIEFACTKHRFTTQVNERFSANKRKGDYD